jgi:hypothetical protein
MILSAGCFNISHVDQRRTNAHPKEVFSFRKRGCKMAVVDYDAVFYGLLVTCELAKKEVNFD